MANDTKGEWLIPFQGRKWSGSLNINLLWRSGSTYIMDNHRAALWCWFQHLSQMQKYNLIHIDRHTDTLYSQIESWKEALPKNFTSTLLNTYLSYEYEGASTRVPVIRWDNYLSLFLNAILTSWMNAFLLHTTKEISRAGRNILKSLLGIFQGISIIGLKKDLGL